MLALGLTTCWSCGCCHGKWKLTRVPTWLGPAGRDQLDGSDHNLSSAGQANHQGEGPPVSPSNSITSVFFYCILRVGFLWLNASIWRTFQHVWRYKCTLYTSNTHIYYSNCANNESRPTQAFIWNLYRSLYWRELKRNPKKYSAPLHHWLDQKEVEIQLLLTQNALNYHR